MPTGTLSSQLLWNSLAWETWINYTCPSLKDEHVFAGKPTLTIADILFFVIIL
jgi:hypothetical protein